MDSEHRSKNLITCSEFTDGNGSSRHGNLSEVTNMTGSTDHFDIRPEVNGGKRSKNPFEIRPEVVGGNESNKLLETHPAVSDGRHSSKYMVMNPATTFYESDLIFPIKSLNHPLFVLH